MMDIKVSILVPAFNTENYIDECLHSLVSQTLEEIEVIVVDDGSTDQTRSIADRYARSDARVRVVHQEHLGVSAARNHCLSLAKGKYLGFVDSDDFVSKEAFEQLFVKAEQHSADIVLGSILYCYADNRSYRVGDKSAVFIGGSDVLQGKMCLCEMIRKTCYTPMVCGNLYLRSFVHHHALQFEGQFHEDEYFSPYALYYAERVVDFKSDFYYYRQHEHSIMHSDNLKERAESLWRVGDQLKRFASEQVSQKAEREVCLSLEKLSDELCRRAQLLYEKELLSSTRPCLLIFSETSTAARYGVGTYIRQLGRCFDSSEWDVNVITLHALHIDVQWKMEDGIANYAIPIPLGIREVWSQTNESLYYKSVYYFLITRLATGKRIYCHFNFVSHYELAVLFKVNAQAKILFTLHYTDWSFDLLGDKGWLRRILSNPNGKKEERVVEKFNQEKKFMLECCDRVIAIAHHSYSMLKDLYGIPESKLVCIPNGLEDEYRKRDVESCRSLREKYGFGEDDILIIFAGRLDLVKGVSELIEAFKLLQQEIPAAKLIIAGSGNFTRCFEVSNPCWSHIVFTGFIPKEQLYELYAIAQMGVVPSIHEEFGYVAVEMMLNELPIVVNNTTGLKEIVEDGGYGVVFDFGENRNIQSLKDAMLSLMFDKTKKSRVMAGRNRVIKEYSLQLFRERITDVYGHMDFPCSFNN